MRFIRWYWLLPLCLIVGLCTLLSVASATWLDLASARATGGRLRLADVSGSIWQGTARVVLADVQATEGASAQSPVGLALPQAVSWELAALPLFVGRIDAQIRVEGMAQPVLVRGSFRDVTGTGGAIELPNVRFDRVGSPWNTVQPQGKLSLRWQPFRVLNGRFTGQAELEMADVSSAISQIKPLGHYKVQINGQGEQAQIGIQTVRGPLLLNGDGQWTAQRGLRFTAQADAEGDDKIRLAPLLGLLGRRDGDKTIIKIGA